MTEKQDRFFADLSAIHSERHASLMREYRRLRGDFSAKLDMILDELTTKSQLDRAQASAIEIIGNAIRGRLDDVIQRLQDLEHWRRRMEDPDNAAA